MVSQPLSYDALKTILQYIDANKRYVIYRRIPSTRTADRVTPLFIAKLGFNGYDLTINDVKYTLRICATNQLYWNGIYQEYRFRMGTYTHDLDQYGIHDVFADGLLTPGDLLNEEKGEMPTEDDMRTEIDASIVDFEEHIEEERIAQNQFGEGEEGFEYHQRQIEQFEAKLIPYRCYQENRPLPYDINPYIEFRQETPTGLVKEEFLSYNRKLPEAMKYLTTKLFGDRRHPIKVRRLVNAQKFYGTIRLPANLKMEVRELDVVKMSEATQVLPVILDSKVAIFRLDSPQGPDFEMEILKTARSLIIGCSEFLDWLPRAQNLQNRKVLLMGTDFNQFPNNYTLLMKHWIDNGKELGTCFSFGLRKSAAERVLNMAKEQFGGLEIKMKNECRLVVSMNEMNFEEEEGIFIRSWKIDMKVADK